MNQQLSAADGSEIGLDTASESQRSLAWGAPRLPLWNEEGRFTRNLELVPNGYAFILPVRACACLRQCSEG
jgi:hypothetical protein